MVIVDTTVWVDYLRGIQTPQVDWLDKEIGLQRIGLTDLNLCEVLQGLQDTRQATRAQREFENFVVFSTGGRELAIRAAANYRKLRAVGFTIRKTIDCLIATFCISNGHALLHRDRDFKPFEDKLGLRVVHP
jgi:predicted nucleic acid-binding protein